VDLVKELIFYWI